MIDSLFDRWVTDQLSYELYARNPERLTMDAFRADIALWLDDLSSNSVVVSDLAEVGIYDEWAYDLFSYDELRTIVAHFFPDYPL